MTHDDPFDLDDHRPRRPTNRDRLIAAGVRETERQRASVTVEVINCPDCDGDGYCTACGGTGGCAACDGTGTNGDCEILSPASALTRAWEAESGKDQVVS
jgi:RecJ-like exonuclease